MEPKQGISKGFVAAAEFATKNHAVVVLGKHDGECTRVKQFVVQRAHSQTIVYVVWSEHLDPFDVCRFEADMFSRQTRFVSADSAAMRVCMQNVDSESWVAESFAITLDVEIQAHLTHDIVVKRFWEMVREQFTCGFAQQFGALHEFVEHDRAQPSLRQFASQFRYGGSRAAPFSSREIFAILDRPQSAVEVVLQIPKWVRRGVARAMWAEFFEQRNELVLDFDVRQHAPALALRVPQCQKKKQWFVNSTFAVFMVFIHVDFAKGFDHCIVVIERRDLIHMNCLGMSADSNRQFVMSHDVRRTVNTVRLSRTVSR